jgi:ABC-2 type transport system ATP-binding protein
MIEYFNNMVIKVNNLIKTYGDVTAVNNISFNVKKGEVFGMLGPNGAGKTTTVEILEGLRPADSGSISVLGLDIFRFPNRVKQLIGVQLQAPALIPLLTVEEILDLFSSFYTKAIPVKELLDMLALQESRKVRVKNLSGGQQQRLSVAVALVNDPDIAFLDEPTTGLDPQARRSLWSVIENIRARGKTVFLTTHYMEEAERLCDRLIIVDKGKIIAEGTPHQLITDNFEERAIEFEIEPLPDKFVMENLPDVKYVNMVGNSVTLHSENISTTMSALFKHFDKTDTNDSLKNLRVREATLEDVFLKLTGRKIRE